MEYGIMEMVWKHGRELVLKWYGNGINIWYASMMLNLVGSQQNYGSSLSWKLYVNCMEKVCKWYGNGMEMESIFGMLQ